MNLKMFEKILKMTQKDLKQYLAQELKQLGYKPKNKKGFLYAEGSVPVMLVAHLDTVHSQSPQLFLYSKDKRHMASPTGIGGDDRCGVYMILEIIKNHKCHILFTEDEEIGGVGATAFSESKIEPNINYMIEFDRKGSNDCVFYDDGNTDFQNFIIDFGFVKDFGSFSDISFIAPALGISAVNLSSGYYNAHTKQEYIDLMVVDENIKRVKEIIQTKTEKFEYICNYDKYNNYDKYIYQNYSGYEDIYEDLMYIDDGYIITSDGELVDGYDYFIDKNNNVYEYCWEYECAILINAQAFNAYGMPLKFNKKKAESVPLA